MSDFRLLTKLNRKIFIQEADVPGQYGTDVHMARVKIPILIYGYRNTFYFTLKI